MRTRFCQKATDLRPRRRARNLPSAAPDAVEAKCSIPRRVVWALSGSNRPALGIEPRTPAPCDDARVRYPSRRRRHGRSIFYRGRP